MEYLWHSGREKGVVGGCALLGWFGMVTLFIVVWYGVSIIGGIDR